MAVYKNVASQKIAVYAYDTAADEPKTGDAANITARISKDGAAVAQTDDVNPTELDATHAKGVYIFDMTQAETNADLLVLCAKSATADVQIEPAIIYTLPGTNEAVAADTIAISGDATAADTLELFVEALKQDTGQIDDGTFAVGAITADAVVAGDTGITLQKALEMLAAFIAGKVSRSSDAGVTTLTYKKRDGSTTSFTAVCDEDDGDRATTGSLS